MPNANTKHAYKLLDKYGYRRALVERFNGFIQRSQDLFGFIDVVALRVFTGEDLHHSLGDFDTVPEWHAFQGVLGVQVCAVQHLQPHLDKLLKGEPRDALYDWLRTGNRCEVWAFKTAASKRTKNRYGRVQFRPYRLTLPQKKVRQVQPRIIAVEGTELELLGWKPAE